MPLAEKGVRTPHQFVKRFCKGRYPSEWLPSAVSLSVSSARCIDGDLDRRAFGI
jgi:hypothetical protein